LIASVLIVGCSISVRRMRPLDFGYEPSFLFEMERIQPETDPKKKRGSRWFIGQLC